MKSKLLQDVLGDGVTFLHVGGNAGEVQAIESQFEEGFGSFRRKAASPVGAGDVVPQSDSGAVVGGVESAAADVFPISFENWAHMP